jgi:hypothetical protein
MSLAIPQDIERDIQKFAQEEHITHDEAVLRLIETGLSVRKPVAKSVFEQPARLSSAVRRMRG